MVDCLIPGTENMDALRGGAWHYGFHMAPEIPEMLTKGRERDYIAAQIRAWSYKKGAVSEAAITEFARHYATAGGMTAGFNYYRALRDDAVLAASFEGRTLDMPILAIAGRHGVGTKLADGLRQQARNLTAVIAEDSGHFVAEELLHFFCDQVGRFLAAGFRRRLHVMPGNQACRRAMREQAPVAVGDPALGGADAAAPAQHDAFCRDQAGLRRDRPHE